VRVHTLVKILDAPIADVLSLAIRLEHGRVLSEFTVIAKQTALGVVDHFERESKRDRFAEARKAIANFSKQLTTKD